MFVLVGDTVGHDIPAHREWHAILLPLLVEHHLRDQHLGNLATIILAALINLVEILLTAKHLRPAIDEVELYSVRGTEAQRHTSPAGCLVEPRNGHKFIGGRHIHDGGIYRLAEYEREHICVGVGRGRVARGEGAVHGVPLSVGDQLTMSV